MRILITGGYGFVGGRIAQALVKKGHQVILASRSNQSADWLTSVQHVKVNWNDQSSLVAACNGMDIVIHAAGMNAQDSKNNPIAAFEVNALFTGRLVEAAKENEVKRILYFSTAHIYSNILLDSISEDACPRNYHPYASSHLAGESFVLGATGIEGVVIRLSNAFGTPIHPEVNCWMLLVNDLCRQIVEHGKITLRSDVSQLRDFVSMRDMVVATNHLIETPVSDNPRNIFNVGGDMTLSIDDMATLIAFRCEQLWGWTPLIERKSLDRHYLSARLNYRIDKLKSTGYVPRKEVEQEIDETLLFCKRFFGKDSD